MQNTITTMAATTPTTTMHPAYTYFCCCGYHCCCEFHSWYNVRRVLSDLIGRNSASFRLLPCQAPLTYAVLPREAACVACFSCFLFGWQSCMVADFDFHRIAEVAWFAKSFLTSRSNVQPSDEQLHSPGSHKMVKKTFETSCPLLLS